ncbi:hypothetical protein P618_200147 [Holospora obtusa F1]|uniref:Outer membrane protein beta-barrel domain-containing protein n=1 Tax=Holospora obtusa F1 TaxID=1399147 RepID=W6TF92_HOLOB|nr:hypothetical protein [Holospora obtusa]ETZ07656.1 hypothetical protein P618_200147 [Holospora obtusa F1]
MKSKLKFISVLGLVLAFHAKASGVVPCFTSGAYFGLGTGISNSYNRLKGSQGFDVFTPGNMTEYADKVVDAPLGQAACFFGTNNIAPSGWSGLGATVLPELGYVTKIPRSCFTMGVFLNGGIARSTQNAEVPYLVQNSGNENADDYYETFPTELNKGYMQIKSKGTISLGLTFGFTGGANHYYVLIGWNNTKFSVGPQFNAMYANQINFQARQGAIDPTQVVRVKNASGNISGVSFGFGFDRQITPGFSVGIRLMALNSGGSKGIKLPEANYILNGLAYNRPVITVRPFVTSAMVMLKYTFLPKKK